MLTVLSFILGVLFFLLPIIALAAIGLVLLRRLSVFDRFSGEGRSRADDPGESLPYRKKDYLLTRAERSFYGVLQEGVAGDYLIFPKVRLADLLWMPKGTERRQSHFNRISNKHIDFVLCDRDTVAPLLAIELDDRSHERSDRQERDSFVDAAFRAARLPVLHIQARTGYSGIEVGQRVRGALGWMESAVAGSLVRANTGSAS